MLTRGLEDSSPASSDSECADVLSPSAHFFSPAEFTERRREFRLGCNSMIEAHHVVWYRVRVPV